MIVSEIYSRDQKCHVQAGRTPVAEFVGYAVVGPSLPMSAESEILVLLDERSLYILDVVDGNKVRAAPGFEGTGRCVDDDVIVAGVVDIPGVTGTGGDSATIRG